MKKVIFGVITAVTCLWVPAANAATPCEILEAGNKLYSTNSWDKAFVTYSTVEQIDRIGKDSCTGGIYATIGNMHKYKADAAFPKDTKLAAEQYRSAAKYFAAFAYAVACNKGDCKLSEAFWKEQK